MPVLQFFQVRVIQRSSFQLLKIGLDERAGGPLLDAVFDLYRGCQNET